MMFSSNFLESFLDVDIKGLKTRFVRNHSGQENTSFTITYQAEKTSGLWPDLQYSLTHVCIFISCDDQLRYLIVVRLD